MVTKVFKNLIKYFVWFNKESYRYYGDEFNNVQGQTRYIKAGSSSTFPFGSMSFVTNLSSDGFRVGSGTTTPTENDYALESMITSGVSGSASVQNNTDSSNPDKLYFTVTVRNTSSSSITVSEIGYYMNLRASTSQNTTSSSSYLFLMDRTLLDTPVTIPPGESVIINYTIDPTDSE